MHAVADKYYFAFDNFFLHKKIRSLKITLIKKNKTEQVYQKNAIYAY